MKGMEGKEKKSTTIKDDEKRYRQEDFNTLFEN